MTTNLKTQRAHPAQVALTWENDEQAAKKPPSQNGIPSNFCKEKDNKLSQLDLGANGVEKDRVRLRGTAYHTAFTYLDGNTGKHQDWFDENDEEI